MNLDIDLETFSETPIQRGTFVYAADSEVMLVAYSIDAGPITVWDVTTSKPMPADLRAALVDQATVITAHNAQFDANVLALARNSTPEMRAAGEDISRWRCTMAQALSHSLPAKLSALGEVLHLPAGMLKDDGGALIHLFCKPLPVTSSLRRATRETHPVEWARFSAYAGQDIVAMRESAKRMPNWNWQPRDIALWHLDQIINRRGFQVDEALAKAAGRICAERARDNAEQTVVLTDGSVQAVTQRDRLMKHILAEHGVDLPDLRAVTLARRIDDPDLPWAVRELMALRLSGAKNSTSKYRTLLRSVSDDGRLRGTLQFRGASRTGRDAGRVFQPQNLPRPKAEPPEIEGWIGLAKMGATELVGYDDVQMAGDALRGCIVAAGGKKIVQADFSNIEGRLVAWVAGEQWKIDAFRAFDAGTGPDLYKLTYSRAFGTDVERVNGEQRQHGKVIDLAGGFGGWIGACRTFADVYRVEIPSDAVAAKWMGGWRSAHPNVVALWRRLEDSAKGAVSNPDRVYKVNDKLSLVRRGPWLKIQLPSGRILSYPHVGLDARSIKFKGQSQYTRKWGDVWTYGGKLFENIVQAVAGDLLWHAVGNCERAGYPVVLRVHDEVLTEVPDRPEFNVAGLCRLMTDAPAWAAGLPIAAAGFEAKRYRK